MSTNIHNDHTVHNDCDVDLKAYMVRAAIHLAITEWNEQNPTLMMPTIIFDIIEKGILNAQIDELRIQNTVGDQSQKEPV